MSAAELIKTARLEAGLTQAALAARLGTTQTAIARLERRGANPRIDTVDRVMRALGRRLELVAPERLPDVDEEQIRSQLRLSPAELLRLHTTSQQNLVSLLGKAQ